MKARCLILVLLALSGLIDRPIAVGCADSDLDLIKDQAGQPAVPSNLEPTRQAPVSNGAQNTKDAAREEGLPAYYFTIDGVDDVTVRDCCGNSNEPIEDTIFRGEVPGVNFEGRGEKAFGVIMPAVSDPLTVIDFTITFRSGKEPILIELLKGDGTEAPLQAIRYRDLNLPPGVEVQLKITEAGVDDLRYDADGNGTFETVIPPTAAVVGALALDVEAPKIHISGTYQQNTALVTITATDSGSGVKRLFYSLDNRHYQPYTKPFSVNLTQVSGIYTYADDNVANRGVEDLEDLKPSLSPANQNVAAKHGSGNIVLIAPSGFNWTVTANNDWIVLTSAESGSGSYMITFETKDNFTHQARAGTLTIAGLAYKVIQDGGSNKRLP